MSAHQDLGIDALSGEDRFVGEYPAVAGSVRRARDAVAELAERLKVGRDLIEDVRLAVSEAATNVVMHAYEQRGATETFEVLAVVRGERMIVVVEDNGCGLRSPAHQPGLGAGLRVMAQVADEATFLERDGGGSCVRLSFSLA